MTTPRHRPDDPMRDPMLRDLESALTDLRAHVHFPPTPDLAASVSATLQSVSPATPPSPDTSTPPVILSEAKNPPRGPRSDDPQRPSSVLKGRRSASTGFQSRAVLRRRPGRDGGDLSTPRSPLLAPRSLLPAALVTLILLGAALTLSDGLRSAVADRLGLPGIRLELVDGDETTSPAPSPASLLPPASSPSPAIPFGVTLLLGEPMTLVEAQAAVTYPIRVPATLGLPDEVYVRPVGGGAMVTLLYRARPGLPAAAETGVGALLMQFPADVDGADIAKKVLFAQGPDPIGSLTELTVAGAPGYWIVGASELTLIEDPAAGWETDPSRPSANVLIWASGGITYRLETDLLLPAALALAESLTPTDPATPTP